MAKVYYTSVKDYSKTNEISLTAKKLFEKLIKENNVQLEKEIPLKVHFGEKGNETFISPKNYEGIIDYLKENNIDSFFTDTNVLYKGERTFSDTHIAIAKKHGFTQLPIKIADGDHGEDYEEIEINKKHFDKCKIGKLIADKEQLIVLSHFKGHVLAGFGGSIKQLSMGCAARGGKLAMHANAKPLLNTLACKKCMACVEECPVDAITIGKISRIDYEKCIGCASCIAVCPYNAMKINWASTMPKKFNEKLSEYALAAQKNKKCFYINFVFNITKNCDCDGTKMKPIAKDIGVLASMDPVALDKACLDLLRKNEGKKVFRGDNQLSYSEKIGLGKQEYDLIEISE